MKALNFREATVFLHTHAEELRTRAKRGLSPGAKIGRSWVFIDDDLAALIRTQYSVTRQARWRTALENAGRFTGSSLQTMQEYNKPLGLNLRHSTLARAMPRLLSDNAISKPENQEVVVQSPTDPATTRDESGVSRVRDLFTVARDHSDS